MSSGEFWANVKAEETKRATRILDIVQRITIRPSRWLRRDLAAAFEVSERQIQKDLEIIRHGLLLPLMHTREGYYFESIPRLPAAVCSFSEGLALLLAARAAQEVPGIDPGELAAAVARLEAVFPPQFHTLLRQLAQGGNRTATNEHREAMLGLLHQAIFSRRQVRMVYATASRGGQTSERTIEPYHVMPYVRSWHLVAFCHNRKQVLQFKIDRIQQAELLDETYTIPADFDLDEYLGDGWGLIRGGEPVEIELMFSAEAGRWVSEERWHPSQQAARLPDGRVRFTLQVAVTPEFVNWILYYGSRVEVIRPAELRERVAEAHRQAAEVYGV